ncbi:MAG: NAD(P)/FAD-dependent oxidoreductase [Euryarchaeota archaeon]|nr:NAD(P)/FAD-dependent oxidoreductase [Euryarchaeota archaeon]
MKDYDVMVVGAGPVGSTFARYMAERGFKVGILEKKKEIGVPLQCAGLVGKKIKDVNFLPEKFILNQVYGAHLHSPSGTTVSVSKGEPEAYVLDRVAYDQFLAKLAVQEGAELRLNHKVEHVNIETGEVYLKNAKFSAEVVVGAGGYSSVVSKEFNPEPKTVKAAQYLVDMGEDTFNADYVNLYVNSEISPGFLWVIPLSESTARIGLFSNLDYSKLNQFLNGFLNNHEEFKKATILKKYHGIIPVYDPKKEIVKDRAILIGDAASQVKPTTGGGLNIGFACAKMASKAVSRAIETGNPQLLREYQTEYRKRFKDELKIQLEVQKSFELLNNDDLDFLFTKLKKEGTENVISQYGDMDSQSLLVKHLVKSGLIFSVLPKVIFRRISNLWSSF